MATITPEIEADFLKRDAAYRDYAKIHPDATIDELMEYLEKIKPSDAAMRSLYTRWAAATRLRAASEKSEGRTP